MSTKKFNLTILGIAVTVGLLITILAIIGEKLPPRLVSLNLAGTEDAAEFVNQQLEVQFSRPMNWNDLKNKISVTPATTYEVFWNMNTLFVSFTAPLQPNTDYDFKIAASASDNYGDQLRTELNVKFKTKQRLLAFLSKDSNQDKILLANDALKVQTELYSAPNIELFKIIEGYLVVVVQASEGSEQLIVKDLNTGNQVIVEQGSVRITALDISRQTRQLIYIMQPVELYDGIAIPSDVHIMKIASLTNPSPQELKPTFPVTDYMDVRFSDDGLGVVFRDQDGTYALMDIQNPAANVSLGRHIWMSNFSFDGGRVIMLDQPVGNVITNFPPVSQVDSNRNIKTLFNGSEFVVDPMFLNQSNRVVYSTFLSALQGAKGVFEVKMLDLQTGKITPILRDNQNRSLELPKPSPDDELLVIERYTVEDQLNFDDLRSFGFQAKPAQANLIMVNLKTGEISDPNIRGVDAMWVE